MYCVQQGRAKQDYQQGALSFKKGELVSDDTAKLACMKMATTGWIYLGGCIAEYCQEESGDADRTKRLWTDWQGASYDDRSI
jgi:hypothetical protein